MLKTCKISAWVNSGQALYSVDPKVLGIKFAHRAVFETFSHLVEAQEQDNIVHYACNLSLSQFKFFFEHSVSEVPSETLPPKDYSYSCLLKELKKISHKYADSERFYL